MEVKTALGIALALAIGLPYVTVALMQGGRFGLFAIGALFVAAFLLVVVTDLRGGEQGVTRDEDTG